ncbi:hypothetical protein K1T71_003687 [Dendrolimus kikuchii]|uniref:Uncharacterized protein n=1 Tax=Dendrolimus kikuchii TaxID=765133 RepID=A0ACC1D9M7_9NEOP|nr:hypothetical protein K1T71_003687 [Dendrolimus kikuchii]
MDGLDDADQSIRLLVEDTSDHHISVLNKSSLLQYKISLRSSSNAVSNILLKETWKKHIELCNNETVENILHCSNQLLKNVDTSNTKTWACSLSKINAETIFEKSLPQCSKCSSSQPEIFANIFTNGCKCDLPVTKTNKNNNFEKPEPSFIRTLSSEGSSQESNDQKFKPRFGKQRQVKNQHITPNIQQIDLTDDIAYNKTNNFCLEDDKPTKNTFFKSKFKSYKGQNADVECSEEDTNEKYRTFPRSSYKSTYKVQDKVLADTIEERWKSHLDEEMGPSKKPMSAEEEERAHKSNVAKITFKTAKETLLASNPAAKRTLGASRKAQAKFVSPMIGAQEKPVNEAAITDERLKHIDPKMIELIESEIIDKGTPIDWEDIAGLQLAKSVIQEAVVWPLLRPDIFTGLRRPPKGILLFGPPGTGKTLIGKCIASQCNATFFSISASSLTSKWIGDGEKMVRALFAVAVCHQPAVIFIDEIDSLLTQRSDSEHEATRRIKTEFLVQFDGAATGDEDRILIVGATNRPQELDEAARRRLVKRLYIPLPDVDARKQIISNLLKTENNDLDPCQVLEIANLTEGYSGADMKSLCSEAAMGPIRSVPLSQIVTIQRNKVRPVCLQDFINALQRVKPSVSQDDLGQYVRWNKTYGQGF